MISVWKSETKLNKILKLSWWQHHLTWKGASQGHTTTKSDARAPHLPTIYQDQVYTGITENQELMPHQKPTGYLSGHLTATVVQQWGGEEYLVPKECNTAHAK